MNNLLNEFIAFKYKDYLVVFISIREQVSPRLNLSRPTTIQHNTALSLSLSHSRNETHCWSNRDQ